MTTTAARLERAFDTPCNCCSDCVPLSTDGRSVFMDGFGEIPLNFNASAQADEIAKLKCEAGVLREKLNKVAHELRYYNPAADEYKGLHIHKYWAKEIDAALCPVPVVQFVAVDDTEGGEA